MTPMIRCANVVRVSSKMARIPLSPDAAPRTNDL